MRFPKTFPSDRQSSPIKWPGLPVARLGPVEVGQVVEGTGPFRVLLTQHLFSPPRVFQGSTRQISSVSFAAVGSMTASWNPAIRILPKGSRIKALPVS